jgi:glutamate 5-kinase
LGRLQAKQYWVLRKHRRLDFRQHFLYDSHNIRDFFMQYKSIVVKIGTHVLTNNKGLLDVKHMAHIVDQIVDCMKAGVTIIIVTSGAMGAGRAKVELVGKVNEIVARQVYAAIGQVDLMNVYSRLFKKRRVRCAQVLASKEDFLGRNHYLNMRNCFEALLYEGIVPIVNENDVVAVDELMFTDNDELAGQIGTMLGVDAVLLLTSVDGLLTGDPNEKGSELIKSITCDDTTYEQYIQPTQSLMGRGGMNTKVRIAKRLAGTGITTHILNGKTKNSIKDLLKGNSIGTRFIPSKKKMANPKKRLAYTNGYEKGKVHLNAHAEEVLLDKEVARSLLPIGITKVDGEFEKGDIVKIVNHKGEGIGFGLAQYGSKTAREYLGKKSKKPLVHYDYLYLEA